jgi:hypothetical protein
MAIKSFSPGDVTIQQISIVNIDETKTVNIIEQVQHFDIYESILSPVIFGRINIVDKVNIREGFPLLAEKCKVLIQFVTPSRDPVVPPRKFELLVTSIENVVMDPNASGSSYDLHLTSIEIIENAKAVSLKGLRGGTIDTYVRSILTNNLKTKKQIITESRGTKGIQELDFLLVKPFQIIDMLKQRATSNRYKSNVYVFFENKLGFNFVPIEFILSDQIKLIKDAMFFYDSDSRSDVKNITYRNILGYNHISQQNTAKLMSEGALNNRTKSIDIKTRNKVTKDFTYSKAQEEFEYAKGAKPIHSASFESQYGSQPSKTFNMIKSSGVPDTYMEDKLGYGHAFISMLTQNIVRVLVWGDSYLSAGYRIRLETPKPKALTKVGGKQKSENSDITSGEYLISHIRHSISKQNLDFRYFSSMELINATYGKAGGFDT